ncbi:murein hydrolase activator EnvC [Micromonospora sp. MW-13]|uniref:murein hydrolase activator EnvC family protein n=1 Tax=Micromonospora sp. MW-13 TaxID=2094022 RepID=UPI00352F455D
MAGAALGAVVLAAGHGSGPGVPPQSGAAGAVVVSAVGPGPVLPGPVPSGPLPSGPVPSGPVPSGPVLSDPVLPGSGPAAGAPGAAARTQPSAPDVRFRWPLDGAPRLARRFTPPPQPWLPGHRGVDLVAAPGAVVRAAGPGVVLFAGPVAGRPVVTVGHDAGLRTTYEPVRPGVRAGDRVTAGTPLGWLRPGHAGCPEPACLHWGLRRAEEYLDPLALLGLGPLRLLPI